jgi:Cupredoxin-like domain
MSNTNKILIAVVIVVVIAVGAWLATGNKPNQTTNTHPPAADTGNGTNEDETVAATITYDGNHFSPSTVSVKSDTKIKIMNQTQKEMRFASNDHPTHLKNSELNTGDIAPGSSKTFTVTTKGTWGFHDHYNASKGGTITVE